MDVRSGHQKHRTTSNHPELGECIDRHDNGLSSSTSVTALTAGVEDWVWEGLVKDCSLEEKELIEESWKPIALEICRTAIRRWLCCYEKRNINPESPWSKGLARLLADFYMSIYVICFC